MEERANSRVAFSHMQMLAGVSVVALVALVLWQVGTSLGSGSVVSAANHFSLTGRATTPFGSVNWQAPFIDTSGGAEALGSATDPDGISNISDNVVGALVGSYTALSQAGSYTPQEGEKIAGDIAESLRASVSYKTYAASDVQTDSDTSYQRMLTYRNDLRTALEPLLKNPGYELSLFANYIESRDQTFLEKLRSAARNYRDAAEASAHVIVPKDALSPHVDILNALSEFGATIERMTAHADDAFASAALLRTYDAAELKLFTSFNTLATYERGKTP